MNTTRNRKRIPSKLRPSSTRVILAPLINKLRCRKGGAIIEFVALALPLFIPIFIFLNQYGLVSDTESSLRTLAREMSRAMVTSENDEIASRVAAEIFTKGGSALGFDREIASGDIQFSIQCSKHPCISPDNQIQINIEIESLHRTVSAVEYVSPWA